MNRYRPLSERDLAPFVVTLRDILASEEYPDERHRKAALRRALHESATGLDGEELKELVERIRARFPDRTYESLALARDLGRKNAELEREVAVLREEREELEARLAGVEQLLDKLWGRLTQPAAGGGKRLVGGSSAAAPRNPEPLAPVFEALGDLVEFASKLETIALSVEQSLGRSAGRPIDAPDMASVWTALARSEGDEQAHLVRLRDKLAYLGLLPAAVVAGVNQSWRGGTRELLERLDPKKCEEDISTKFPVLRDKAVLDEVRDRFQQFWSQLDDNVAHYYRGTFEKVYAEKMEERR